MNLFFGGIEMRNVCPSLTISKARLRTTGNSPIMRSMVGLRTRMYPRMSVYSVTLPFFAPPTEGEISTMALTVLI